MTSIRRDVPAASRLEIGLAYVVTAVAGAWVLLPYNIPLGGVIGVALFPLWLSTTARFRLVRTLALLASIALVSGLLLTWAASFDRVTQPSSAIERSAMLVGLLGAAFALLWAREILGTANTSVAFGLGAMLGIIPDLDAGSTWRFTFSIPVTLLVLALASRSNRLMPQLTVIVILMVVGALNGSRSNTAMLALVGAILVWQRFRTIAAPKRRRAGSLLSLALLAVAVFLVAQAAILEGYFGEAAQARSEAQIQGSGSIILGGRPEAAAASALIANQPFGMGSGTVAASRDIAIAKAAMADIGYDPHNGYVNRYMFGGGIEVHSLLGDFWIWFGIPGVLVCLALLAIVLLGLDNRLRVGAASALPLYLAARFVWDLAFSPAITSMKLLPLTIALLAVAANAAVAARSGPSTSFR